MIFKINHTSNIIFFNSGRGRARMGCSGALNSIVSTTARSLPCHWQACTRQVQIMCGTFLLIIPSRRRHLRQCCAALAVPLTRPADSGGVDWSRRLWSGRSCGAIVDCSSPALAWPPTRQGRSTPPGGRQLQEACTQHHPFSRDVWLLVWSACMIFPWVLTKKRAACFQTAGSPCPLLGFGFMFVTSLLQKGINSSAVKTLRTKATPLGPPLFIRKFFLAFCSPLSNVITVQPSEFLTRVQRWHFVSII
jgi:hypothetical protein